MSKRAIDLPRCAAWVSPSLAATIEPFIRMWKERARDSGVAQASFLGEATHDRADLLEMPDAGAPRRVFGAHLKQDIDKRACLEVVAVEPFVEDIEDGQQPPLRIRVAADRARFD